MNEGLRIGEWTVHPELGRLSSAEETVTLEPRLMQVLLHLAAHPGVVLPKENLLEAVWKDIFVAENTLMNVVSELRKALGDDTRSPRFIQTHAKRGYRLIAPVTRVRGPSRDPRSARPRLAIEPFSPCGPTDASSVLADMLTERVSTLLARSSRVSIVSRTSVNAGRRSACSLPELAERLGADLVLEGAVSGSKERIWISARLFDTHEESLWGELMEHEGAPRTTLEMAASGLVERIEATPRLSPTAAPIFGDPDAHPKPRPEPPRG